MVELGFDFDVHRLLVAQSDDVHHPFLRQLSQRQDHLFDLLHLDQPVEVVETAKHAQAIVGFTDLFGFQRDKAHDPIAQSRKLFDLVRQPFGFSVPTDDERIALSHAGLQQFSLHRVQDETAAGDTEDHEGKITKDHQPADRRRLREVLLRLGGEQ
ncbi:MAG: hypothetical protein BWY83_02635 [bacterium ADurb.Bin478]|nr:MAG: hypothetical protein BWY83_02635 [bacterium ADurb.Bin478]